MYTDRTKKVDSVIQGKLSQFSKQMKFSDLRCIYETGYGLVFLITLITVAIRNVDLGRLIFSIYAKLWVILITVTNYFI